MSEASCKTACIYWCKFHEKYIKDMHTKTTWRSQQWPAFNQTDTTLGEAEQAGKDPHSWLTHSGKRAAHWCWTPAYGLPRDCYGIVNSWVPAVWVLLAPLPLPYLRQVHVKWLQVALAKAGHYWGNLFLYRKPVIVFKGKAIKGK